MWELFRNVQSQRSGSHQHFRVFSAALVTPALSVYFCLHFSAGHERADADHWLASSGGLCWQLVWKGEVSSARLTVQEYIILVVDCLMDLIPVRQGFDSCQTCDQRTNYKHDTQETHTHTAYLYAHSFLFDVDVKDTFIGWLLNNLV